MRTVKRPLGWNMRSDDQAKGAKGCEKVGKGSSRESGERQSFDPLEKLGKPRNRKE